MDESAGLLAKTIGEIGSESLPASLANWIGKLVPHDNIVVVAYYSSAYPSILHYDASYEEIGENLSRYAKGAYLLDPFHKLHVEQAKSGVYQLKEVAPDHFPRTQYFNEYYKMTGLIDELAFVTYPNSGVSVHVCLGRDHVSGSRFTAKSYSLASTVHPIVSAIANMHWKNLQQSGDVPEGDLTQRLRAGLKSKHNIKLTPRQAQVATLVLRGHSSTSIGLELGISPQTVKVFRKQLHKKCQISSQAEFFQLMLPIIEAEI